MKRLIQAVLITLLIISLSLPVGASTLFTQLPGSINQNFFSSFLEILSEIFSEVQSNLSAESGEIDVTLTSKYKNKVPSNEMLTITSAVLEKRLNNSGFDSITISSDKTGIIKIKASSKKFDEIENPREIIENVIKPGLITFQEVSEKSIDSAGNYKPTGKVIIESKHITDAVVELGQDGNSPEVSISFNKEGTKLFAAATARLIGKPIAIFLDDKLLSAPVVQTQITGGTARITLNDEEPEDALKSAKNLASDLKSGIIPVDLTIKELHIID